MIQHVIRNQSESDAAVLGKLYGVSNVDVYRATFGAIGASVIYPWLKNNGGVRQKKDSNVPTGYNWSWAEYMVVNVPSDGPSQSPLEFIAITPAQVFLKPGGPLVEVLGVSGNALPPAEEPPAYTEKKQEAAAKGEQPPPVPADEVPTMEAGFNWVGILIGGGVAFLAYMMFGGKKTGKGKTKAKRGRSRR